MSTTNRSTTLTAQATAATPYHRAAATEAYNRAYDEAMDAGKSPDVAHCMARGAYGAVAHPSPATPTPAVTTAANPYHRARWDTYCDHCSAPMMSFDGYRIRQYTPHGERVDDLQICDNCYRIAELEARIAELQAVQS